MELVSATSIDPRPRRTARQPSSLPTRVPAGQNDCVVPAALPRKDHTGSIGRRLPGPDAGRAAVGVCHLVCAIAYRIAEVDQDLVERRGRLVPFQLLSVVCGPRFSGPQLLQRRDL